MAFTAGSPELAKAQKLANRLASLYHTFTTTNGAQGVQLMSGATAALMVEQIVHEHGFAMTGFTTGAGFPPFGSIRPQDLLGVAAALQNPRGETRANNIDIGSVNGLTVGIYMPKFVRSGEDFSVTVGGITLAQGYTSGSGNTFSAIGPVAFFPNDKIRFSDGAVYTIAPLGTTSAAAGICAEFRVLGTVTNTYATGAAFDLLITGVTRGTSGVAGSTFGYRTNTVINGGFTACIFYGLTQGGGFTGTLS